jgi:hypothetical protein
MHQVAVVFEKDAVGLNTRCTYEAPGCTPLAPDMGSVVVVVMS